MNICASRFSIYRTTISKSSFEASFSQTAEEAKKQAIIRYATAQVAHKKGLQCKDPGILHEEECKASCFFHSGINAFYLDRDIPRQVFTLERGNIVLQLSHVSCGGVKRPPEDGKWFVLRGNAATAGFKITSTGLLFRCFLPFYFSDTWLLLPRKWGRHLEKITYLNFLVVSFYLILKKPLNLNLFKNENNTLWIYSTASSEQEAEVTEECSFVEKCYSLLRKKSYSLMSFTGNTMYVYIPFNWKMTSEQKLLDCITEYKANIEVITDVSPVAVSRMKLLALRGTTDPEMPPRSTIFH